MPGKKGDMPQILIKWTFSEVCRLETNTQKFQNLKQSTSKESQSEQPQTFIRKTNRVEENGTLFSMKTLAKVIEHRVFYRLKIVGLSYTSNQKNSVHDKQKNRPNTKI